MFNTLIIVLTFLETSKVFSQEITLSQTSTKTIKRFSNTQTSNTTFWIDLKNQVNIYFSIELQILQPNYVDLALLYSYGQPSFIYNNEIIFDDMDYDGFAQHSKQHFVQVINTNETVYFTVLSNVSVSFDVIIKSSNYQLCQNDCGVNGVCIDGECSCIENFIGRDCSQPALKLIQNNKIEYNASQLLKQYFYYQQDGTQSLSLEINNKDLEEIEVYILVPNTIYLPTKEIYNQAAIVTNDEPFKIQINQNKKQQNNDVITEDDQISDEFVVLIYGKNFDIALNVISNESKGEQIKLIIIIVCSVVGALLLCIVAVLIRRAKQRRDREKQSPDVEMEIREKQLAFPPQFNKQELDEYIQIVGKDSLKDNQDNCAICLDPLNNNSSLRTTPCKHVFHSACIEKWLNKNHFCPFCRYDLKIESLKQSSKVVINVPITNIIRIQRNN